jgi:uncharacterized membrane protein YhiD involved in acid resistance
MHTLQLADILLRLGAAFLASFIIGWERQSHGRPAGLRTTILACVAAAVAMVISELVFVEAAAMPGVSSWRPDPGRLGAGVLTGIGFLGGGAILKHSDYVLGVTTAATLWFTTVVGLAFGAGMFALGSLAVGVALIALYVLPSLERLCDSENNRPAGSRNTGGTANQACRPGLARDFVETRFRQGNGFRHFHHLPQIHQAAISGECAPRNESLQRHTRCAEGGMGLRKFE